MSTVLGGGVSMLLRSSGLVVGSRTRFCVSRPAWGIGGSASASPKSRQVPHAIEGHVPALFAECDLSGSCESLADISSCAAVKQDLHEVQELLDAGASLDEEDESGKTLLFLACDCGYLELVQALVNGGATVDLPCAPLNRTPLQQAAFHGYHSIVEYLLKKGASATATDENGHTALSLANASSHRNVVKVLSNIGEL